MDIKTSLDDFKTATLEIKVTGKPFKLEIVSIGTKQGSKAYQKFMRLYKKAISDGTEEFEEITTTVLGVEDTEQVKTDLHKRIMAIFCSEIVSNWKFKESLAEQLYEHDTLADMIFNQFTALAEELATAKKP